jgi:hypothetical protein
MKKFFFSILFSLFTTPILAQVPIDPLKLPDSEAGSYVYTLGIGYTPDGKEREFLDFSDNYLRLTETNNTFDFSLSAGYSFNKHFTIYGNVVPSLFNQTVKQEFNDISTKDTDTDIDVTSGLSLEYRFAPQAVLDPRLSMGVSYPWGLNVQTSATLLKDPVILLGSLAYNRSLENSEDGISFGIGAGFIANEHISFSATASHFVPLEEASFSTTSISFRTGYNLDQSGSSELGFKTTLSVNSRETRVGFSLEYGGRGRIGKVIDDYNIDNSESENTTPNPETSPNNQPSSSTKSEDLSNNTSTSQEQLPINPNPESNNNTTVLIDKTPNQNQNIEQSVQEIYRLLEEKDRQIEQLQQQINNLEEKLNSQN